MTAPIVVVVDAAQELGLEASAESCPQWFLLGYHVGREVESGRVRLDDVEAIRRSVRMVVTTVKEGPSG